MGCKLNGVGGVEFRSAVYCGTVWIYDRAAVHARTCVYAQYQQVISPHQCGIHIVKKT
jgi:hypothetical protein